MWTNRWCLSIVRSKSFGVEISMDMIQLARSNNEDLSESITSLQRGDVERLPFRKRSFDAVVFMETLMHVHDPRTAVIGLSGVIRPDGIIILGIKNNFRFHILSIVFRFTARFTGYLNTNW